MHGSRIFANLQCLIEAVEESARRDAQRQLHDLRFADMLAQAQET